MVLTISRLRLDFCLAIAVISAAIADPIVEFASNAGWFGAGSFTDRSNIAVVPALLAGVILLALYLVCKAHALIADRRRSAPIAFLPTVFVLQILVLYVIETSEQLLVWHHTLGSAIWLGGPLPVSLAIHATIGAVIALAMLRSKRGLARTTLRVIALIHAIATRRFALERSLAARSDGNHRFTVSWPVLRAIGERAPPAFAL